MDSRGVNLRQGPHQSVRGGGAYVFVLRAGALDRKGWGKEGRMEEESVYSGGGKQEGIEGRRKGVFSLTHGH